MSSRLKPSKNEIVTVAQYNALVDQICRDQLALEAGEIERDEAINKVREKHEPVLLELGKQISANLLLCEKFAMTNKETLYGSAKSASANLGMHGFRLGNPTLVLLNSKWKWSDVLKALKDKALTSLIRTKEEADKDALKKLPDDELAAVGCRIKQDEAYYIEPKRDNTERLTA